MFCAPCSKTDWLVRTKMRCSDSLQLIDANVDGQLSERIRSQHESHLATCESCAEALERTRRTAEAARAALEIRALPDDFAQRVLQALAPGPRKGLLWRVRKPGSGTPIPFPHR